MYCTVRWRAGKGRIMSFGILLRYPNPIAPSRLSVSSCYYWKTALVKSTCVFFKTVYYICYILLLRKPQEEPRYPFFLYHRELFSAVTWNRYFLRMLRIICDILALFSVDIVINWSWEMCNRICVSCALLAAKMLSQPRSSRVSCSYNHFTLSGHLKANSFTTPGMCLNH